VTGLLTFEQALDAVLSRARRLPTERVPIDSASGRVLAQPACAAVDLPRFPSSAMDGYAIQAVATPGQMPVVGRIAAGKPARVALGAGEAMAIATGGVVPEGSDAVVPIEDAVERDGVVEIADPVTRGANVRPVGGDISAGAEIIPAGVCLRPAQAGALAAAGIHEVVCARVPRVAVVTTGTELKPPGAELGPGEIYESNGLMLTAQIRAAGADVDGPTAVTDDEGAHREVLRSGLELDAVVTSGGVSVGPHDLVRRTAAELGVQEVFWGVAVRPGKPVAFGVRERTLVFGLPGNPVSSLVACELFVRPALLALQGASEPGPTFMAGFIDAAVGRDPVRDTFARARSSVGDRGVVLSVLRGQESHMIARAATADALVLIPRGAGEIATGSLVRYLPL
jgi:molybdopterin molybdotransferase